MKYILLALAFTACTEKKNEYTYIVIGKDTIIAKTQSIDNSGIKRGAELYRLNDSVNVITLPEKATGFDWKIEPFPNIQVETNNCEINYNKTTTKPRRVKTRQGKTNHI